MRLLLFALMLAGLVLSASIPKAFEDRGAAVRARLRGDADRRAACSCCGRCKSHDAGNYRNFLRIIHLAGSATLPFWIAGALVDGRYRLALWAVAVGIETVAPILGFWVPGLGRSSTADWEVEGGHMAERCGAVRHHRARRIGAGDRRDLRRPDLDRRHIGAFLVAFVGSVAMWVIYFNIGAERAQPPDRSLRRSRAAWRATATPISIS